MSSFNPYLGVILVALLLVVTAVCNIAMGKRIENLQKEAIRYGYAQYGPKTGDWEWIVPPEKK